MIFRIRSISSLFFSREVNHFLVLGLKFGNFLVFSTGVHWEQSWAKKPKESFDSKNSSKEDTTNRRPSDIEQEKQIKDTVKTS